MALTWNSQSYRESREGTPTFSVLPTGESRMQTRFYFPWDDLRSAQAQKAFLGYATYQAATFIDGQPVTTWITRTQPFMHPDFGGRYVCDTFDRCEGFVPGDPGMTAAQTANFDEGIAAVAFKIYADGYRHLPDLDCRNTARNGVPDESYCLRNMSFVETHSQKAQSLPAASGLVWGADGAPVAVGSYINLSFTDITLKWWPVPIQAYNEAYFLSIVGSTNSFNFPPSPSPPLAGRPVYTSFLSQRNAGTLIMGTPGKKIIHLADGAEAWEITLRMSFFPAGANYFYRHNPPNGQQPGFFRVVRPGPPVTTLFPPKDWQPAFWPP